MTEANGHLLRIQDLGLLPLLIDVLQYRQCLIVGTYTLPLRSPSGLIELLLTIMIKSSLLFLMSQGIRKQPWSDFMETKLLFTLIIMAGLIILIQCKMAGYLFLSISITSNCSFQANMNLYKSLAFIILNPLMI